MGDLEQRVKQLEMELEQRDRTIRAMAYVNAELVDAINEYGRQEDILDRQFKPKRKDKS